MLIRQSLPLLAFSVGLLMLVSACTTESDRSPASESADNGSPTKPATTADPGERAPSAEPTDDQATSTPETTPEPTAGTAAQADEEEDEDLPFWRRWWEDTDFDNRTVPLEEIESGGVSPDGIPPIDEPKFIGID
ncbi:MAG: hypothetical protein WD401_01515, partial [Thermomicrobiaceae bacterium]